MAKQQQDDTQPDETRVEEKRQAKAKSADGPVLVEAKDVNSLAPETDNSALGGDQVQARVDKEQEAGQRGVKVDPTPNSAYTVAGVTSGEPTPETDQSVRDEARSARQVDGPRAL